MKMTSCSMASVIDAACTVGPSSLVSSRSDSGPRVVAMVTSTCARAKIRASAEPTLPLPTIE
jgi:hypothetical protein